MKAGFVAMTKSRSRNECGARAMSRISSSQLANHMLFWQYLDRPQKHPSLTYNFSTTVDHLLQPALARFWMISPKHWRVEN